VHALVVGAGAWGLPCAAELTRRGHTVTLVDRRGPANVLSSSPGPTRIWRLSHPDPIRVRLAQRSVDAMERLAQRSGRPVFLRRGLLWRDDETVDNVAAALGGEGVAHEVVEPGDVGAVLPGLRPDHRRAVWCEQAGPVLAEASLHAQLELFLAGGGTLRTGPDVVGVERRAHGVRLECADGERLDGDVVVLAPGPGAGALLGALGLDLALRPRLEQVAHVAHRDGTAASDGYPCWFDGPVGDRPALYAMTTPGVGYKLGVDRPLRDWAVDDHDRTPDDTLLGVVRDTVAADLDGFDLTPFAAQVCCWTESPDNRFVIDRLEGGVVLACGDAGEGFKFSALMGEVLADLAEDRPVDADVASFGLARFAGGVPDLPHVLGR
jgi:sarcosine oxidase